MTARRDATVDRQQEKLYSQWRQLLLTPGFSNFLKTEGLLLIELYPEFPHDDAAEMSLIGGILMPDGGELTELKQATIRRLHHLHFYSPINQTIFRAIRGIFELQKKDPEQIIDLVTVGSRLKATKQEIDLRFLTECIERCPGVASLPTYASIVLSSAKMRALYRLAEGLQSAIMAPTHDGGNYENSQVSEPLPLDPADLTNKCRRALDQIEAKSLIDPRKVFEP